MERRKANRKRQWLIRRIARITLLTFITMTMILFAYWPVSSKDKLSYLSEKSMPTKQSDQKAEKVARIEEKQACTTQEAINITDKNMIERVVAAESRGCTLREMEAVAQTIKDRSELWHMSITEVLNQSGQYAEPYNGEINSNVKLAVSNVFDNGVRVFSEPTTHFHNDTVKPLWTANKECRGTIDRTKFYY